MFKIALFALLVLAEKDNGQKFSVKRGAELTVELPENPTTGFTWILYDVDAQLLRQTDSSFQRAESKPGMVGVGGVRIFHLKALKKGATSLRAKMWRQWEGEASVTKRFEVTVNVR